MVGADYRARKNVILGVVGTFLNSNATSADSSRVDLNSAKIGAYGMWWQDGNYVQGYAGGGYDNFDTHRDISLPGFIGGAIPGTTNNSGGAYRVAHGYTGGAEINASLTAGHDWTSGNFSGGPLLSLQYDYLNVAGFNENGAQSLNLNVKRQINSSLKSLVGVHFSYVWNITPSHAIIPFLSAAWEHEYLDGAHTIGADMLGAGFAVDSSAFGRDGVLLDTGITLQWSDRVSFSLRYQGELGRKNYSDNSVFGGVRIGF